MRASVSSFCAILSASARGPRARPSAARGGLRFFGLQRRGFSFRQRLHQLFEHAHGVVERSLVGLRARQRRAVARECGEFLLEPAPALDLLVERGPQRIALGGEIGRRALRCRQRRFSLGQRLGRFRFALVGFRPRLVGVFLRGQRRGFRVEPFDLLARVANQRLLVLDVALHLLDAAAQFDRARFRPLLLARQHVARGGQPMQRRAGARLRVAQSRQIGRRHRLLARAFGLLAGALRDIAGQAGEGALGLGESRLDATPGGQLGERLVATDFRAEPFVALALPRLPPQALDLRIDVLEHVLDADEIVLRPFEPQFRFVSARMQSGDARRLLQHQPPRGGLGRDDLANLALPHHRGRAGAGGGVGEQQLHVARARFPPVDAIGGSLVALDPAYDLDRLGIVEGGGRAAVGIVERQPDFGDVSRWAAPGAREDHVLHAGGAHVLVRILAHDPAHGLDEIGFAAAVRTDDPGQARLDLEFGRIAKTLESGHAQPLELHTLLFVSVPLAQRERITGVHGSQERGGYKGLSSFSPGKQA